MQHGSVRVVAGSAPTTDMGVRMRYRISAAAVALAAFAVPHAAIAQEGEGQKRIDITPYIEASQVVVAQLSPGDDVVTYTSLAAGVDASIQGRNTAASVSLRYERRIGWQEGDPDGDLISGVARASIAVVPRALTFEAGGLAARTRVEGNGSSILSPIIDDTGSSNIYAVYAGPSLKTEVGALSVEAQYRIGYTRVDEPDALVSAPGATPVDVFDESVVHSAQVRVGTGPGTILPVGVAVAAGWQQEEVGNLDQRVKDRWVRGDVTVPVSPTLAFVGGVGYEDVQISHRDALRDNLGAPIIGPDGRYVTDEGSPRQIAYETSGLIWDVGVMWRPSRRTSFEAHVARRYGSMSYYGSLSYQPNDRSSLNVGVYDSISGFGGQINNALSDLPTNFEAIRNPISGDITGCVSSMNQGGICLGNVLGAVRSSTFRARGVSASYSMRLGRWNAGVGAGYDRRKFIGAEGTVLEEANGLTDETIWVAANVSRRLDQVSGVSANLYANWFASGFNTADNSNGYGASASYYRDIVRNLTATAAVSVDGVSRKVETLPDEWSAAALLGMRYSF